MKVIVLSHTQLQDTLRAQSSADNGEPRLTIGEQLTTVTSAAAAAAVDTQQAGKTAATGKKRNTPEPDNADERKSR